MIPLTEVIMCRKLMEIFLFVVFLTSYFIDPGKTLSCRDEEGREIEWFINYKLPRLKKNRNRLIANGEAYAYLQSDRQSDRWRLSNTSVTSSISMLGRTLEQYYNASNTEEITYLFYNDNPPDVRGSFRGHTKGFVIFDNDTGVWVVHSVPRFPKPDYYEYPSTGHKYGQVALCMTFNTKLLGDIGTQLLYNEAFVYSSYLSGNIADRLSYDVKTLFSKWPKYIMDRPHGNVVYLPNTAGLRAVSFAKSARFNKDLYSSLIAPDLDTNLLVESWRHNKKKLLSPFCSPRRQVLDVKFISMRADGEDREMTIRFNNLRDHSKWAVSDVKETDWICIGDINRVETQKKRGGGALCFSSELVGNAFRSMVADTDTCPKP